MGSTGFTFEGIKNGNCIYYYGAEIENPSGIWGMQYKCKVPASTGRKTFKVGNIGIEMEELNQYCTKL